MRAKLAEPNVAGVLAPMRGRVIEEGSFIMCEQFTGNVGEKLSSRETPAASAEPGPASAGGLAFFAFRAPVKGKAGGSESRPQTGQGAQASGGEA